MKPKLPPPETKEPRRGKKTWREKLADDKDLPKVIKLSGADIRRYGGKTLVIPAPREVDALIRTVPRGRLTTINDLRAAMARRHGADVGCPITTGIFAWIAAHAAHEAALEGRSRITPYWRVLKLNGELNSKFPGGIPAVTKKLQAEGHVVEQRGQRFFVEQYDQRLARL